MEIPGTDTEGYENDEENADVMPTVDIAEVLSSEPSSPSLPPHFR